MCGNIYYGISDFNFSRDFRFEAPIVTAAVFALAYQLIQGIARRQA
jgi:hypothetical protein